MGAKHFWGKRKTFYWALFLYCAPGFALNSFDLHNVNQAHQMGFTGKGVTVGVIDGGFQLDHPELKDNLIKVYNNSYWRNYPSHGTHVAGIIAATQTNHKSYGVAYNSKLVGYGNVGSGGSINMFNGYDVKIINNSHNGNYGYLREYAKRDVLVVYAAGNNGQLRPHHATNHGTSSSSNLGAWLTVGNVHQIYLNRDANGQMSMSTQAVTSGNGTNLCVGASSSCVMAAGTWIESLNVNSGHTSKNGTSMAAPLVSGVAALIAEKYPFMGGKQIADVILSTANNSYTLDKKIFIRGKDIIYIANDEHTLESHKTLTIDKVRADLAAVYGNDIAQKANINANLSNVHTYRREDLFGQGIVDAQKALSGLALLDVNRLKDTDRENGTAYYTLDTKGYSAVFENDIYERRWNPADHDQNTQNLIGNNMQSVNAGLKKRGAGMLGIKGNLFYEGPTVIAQGSLALTGPKGQQVTGEIHVQQEGTLLIGTEVSAKKNVKNEGNIHVGSEAQPALLSVAGNFENEGKLSIASSSQAQSRVDIQGEFKQTSGSVDAGALTVANGKALGHGLKAKSYAVSGGAIHYQMRNAAALTQNVRLDLNGLETQLRNFDLVTLSSGSHAIQYTLSPDGTSVLATVVPNVYSDFENGNRSMAKMLVGMSMDALPEDYSIFFQDLNAAPFMDYRATLQEINDLSHLESNELLLSLDNQEILSNVLNLQSAQPGIVASPRYSFLKTTGLKTYRSGFDLHINQNIQQTKVSAFFNYDQLYGNLASKTLGLGAAIYQNLPLLNAFAGVRFSMGHNTAKKNSTLKYNTRNIQIFAGVDKNIAIGHAFLMPTFYVNYHQFHQGQIQHPGVYYRSLPIFNTLRADYPSNSLFARSIHAKNTQFASVNMGLTFQQHLNNTLRLRLHGFYEYRALGKQLKSIASLNDYAGSFVQVLNLNRHYLRLGADLHYESPIDKLGNIYFATLGLTYDFSLEGPAKFHNYNGYFKGGMRF